MEAIKTTTGWIVLGLQAICCLPHAARAGDLNPPAGPVAPTMKSLDDVEPRTAINAANTPGSANSVFRISQPGSYCLTGNVNGGAGLHGIQIESNNVTLDLNGFALMGTAAAAKSTGGCGHRHVTGFSPRKRIVN
jgi:hypothetical protein